MRAFASLVGNEPGNYREALLNEKGLSMKRIVNGSAMQMGRNSQRIGGIDWKRKN